MRNNDYEHLRQLMIQTAGPSPEAVKVSVARDVLWQLILKVEQLEREIETMKNYEAEQREFR